MKSVMKFLVTGLILSWLTSVSCKKDNLDIIETPPGNQVPRANAGPDQFVYLPQDTVNLDGSGSADPDDNIMGYSWSRISGPSSYNIKFVNAVQTQVSLLVEGIYLFELKVADKGSLFSLDTMQITVNPVADPSLLVANAGNDVLINYDLQTCSLAPALIALRGMGTAGPNRSIVSYLWTGPAEFSNSKAPNTEVKNLDPGVHEFVLTVMDNAGAKDLDTMYVKVVSMMNRPRINAHLVPVNKLPHTMLNATVAAAGTKIVFTGGYVPEGSQVTDRVDIYDIGSGVWSTAKLSQSRWEPGVAIHDNKIFLAGGIVPKFNGTFWYVDNSSDTRSSVVDIYDVSQNTWTVAALPKPMATAGASANNRLVFAENDYSAFVSDAAIYNTATDSWSTFKLSSSRRILATTVIGDNIFFAGGDYDNDGFVGSIDVYNAATNIWSVDNFKSPFNQGWAPEGIAIGDKNYWAGGWYFDPVKYVNPTNHVEIRDSKTNASRFACLCQAKYGFKVVALENKIVFFTGLGPIQNLFDIYDIVTDTWSIGVLPRDISQASVVTLNNTIYLAGGYVDGTLSDQVWKLEF